MDMTSYILGRKSQAGGGGGSSMPRRIIVVDNGVIQTDTNKDVLQAIYNDYQEGKVNFDGVYLKCTSQDFPSEDTYFALNDIHVNDNKQFGQLKFIDLKVQSGISNIETIYVWFGLDTNEEVGYISMAKYDMNEAIIITGTDDSDASKEIYSIGNNSTICEQLLAEYNNGRRNFDNVYLNDSRADNLSLNNFFKLISYYVAYGNMYMTFAYTSNLSSGASGHYGGQYGFTQLKSIAYVPSQNRIVLKREEMRFEKNYGYNFLGVNNTTAYTPSGDYNPATKKYVDDQVGAINTILATLTTPNGPASL